MNAILWWVALAVFLLNLPFGFWRSGLRRFSLAWFVAIHAPVPLVAMIRTLAGIDWQATTWPVLLGAYFAGQFVGSRLGTHWRSRTD